MTVTMDLSPLRAKVAEGLAKHSKPVDYNPSYGTAGFRDKAPKLPGVMYRCGMLIAARALCTGKHTGLVITASHNPAEDNGVKLVEPDGSMINPEWEGYANELAQSNDEAAVLAVLARALTGVEALPPSSSPSASDPAAPHVLVGHDTRESCAVLVAAAKDGAQLLCKVEECGLLTTPQVHWMVWKRNLGMPWAEADYYAELIGAFEQLVQGTQPNPEPLYLDCANGVGAPKLAAMAPALAKAGLQLELYNTGAGVLNGGCGSDHVQKERSIPADFQAVPAGSRCAAVDGDADRLLYFTPKEEEDGEVALFDGDRIAALAAMMVQGLLAQVGEQVQDVKVGIVQTAYANGSSTSFLKSGLGCATACTPTGVKHLHHAALAFGVGVYFEANGHGTVVFSKDLLRRLDVLAAGGNSAAAELLALSRLINQAVGDAISGILMVEAALRRGVVEGGLRGWAGLYTDLPSRQSKVVVPDRSAIKTINAETQVSQPEGLQQLIDQEVAAMPQGRSFVRPSGTEDIVRVYAEAATQEQADELAQRVGEAVKKVLG